eukprot:Rhum_TRINITY_DN4929_c0_g1::Rhum_TRINITY_DN4929_c0_g1_i1::g.16145::m.16145/K10849/ERCC1; DNA excision repair protein ERCC-1
MATVVVNPNQQKNPLMQHVKQPQRFYGQTAAGPVVQQTSQPLYWDYMLEGGGATCGFLFVSIRFFARDPKYLEGRITGAGALKGAVKEGVGVRAVLCHYDAKPGPTAQESLQAVNSLCVKHKLTLLVGWNNEECARHIAVLRRPLGQRLDLLKVRRSFGRAVAQAGSTPKGVLASIKTVTKKDGESLVDRVGCFSDVVKAAPERLAGVPGIGPVKVDMLRGIFTASLKQFAKESPPQTAAPPLVADFPRPSAGAALHAAARPQAFVPCAPSAPMHSTKPVPFYPPVAASAVQAAPKVAAPQRVASAAAIEVMLKEAAKASEPHPVATQALQSGKRPRGDSDGEDDDDDFLPIVIAKRARTE